MASVIGMYLTADSPKELSTPVTQATE